MISAPAYYVRALDTMKALPLPPSIAFDVNVNARGLGVQLDEDAQGHGELEAGLGSAFRGSAQWSASYSIRPGSAHMIFCDMDFTGGPCRSW